MQNPAVPYRFQKALHGYALITATATFFLIVAGGLVTSTDSGLAVPDWPLAYGMWFPPMVGGIFYEHGHRMIAAIVGLMILGLAFWLNQAESRRWLRVLGYTALSGVVAQALLGGLTVLLLLPPAVSIAHACLGPIVFCTASLIAIGTTPFQWGSMLSTNTPATCRAFAFMTMILALLQLLLGAVVRHTGWGLAWHITTAILLSISTLSLLVFAHRDPATPKTLLRWIRRLGGLLTLQWILGFGAWKQSSAVMIVTTHMAVGTLFLAQSTLISWQAGLFPPVAPQPLLPQTESP